MQPLEKVPALDRVAPFDHCQIVADGEDRVFGTVTIRAAPGGITITLELNLQQGLIAIECAGQADALLLPPAADVRREVELLPPVDAAVEVIDQRRADSPGVVGAVDVAVLMSKAEVADGSGELREPVHAGLHFAQAVIVQAADFVPFVEVVINLDAPFRPREERTAREAAIVVIDISKRARRARRIRKDRVADVIQIILRQRADAAGADYIEHTIALDLIANEPGIRFADRRARIEIRILARRRRVIDRQHFAVLVHPISEIALIHFRRRHRGDKRPRAGAVAEPFRRAEKEGLVLTVVNPRDAHRPAERHPVIVLFEHAGLVLEVIARVEEVIARELIDRPVIFVRARTRRKVQAPALRAAGFGLEAVGVHGEFRDGVNWRRVQARPFGRAEAAGAGRRAVERDAPRSSLATANRELRGVTGTLHPRVAA